MVNHKSAAEAITECFAWTRQRSEGLIQIFLVAWLVLTLVPIGYAIAGWWHFSVSTSNSLGYWQAFSSTFGGLAGPSASLLAFVGVLWTLLQSRRHQRLMALQDLAASTASRLDGILSRPWSGELEFRQEFLTLRLHLTLLGVEAVAHPPSAERKEQWRRTIVSTHEVPELWNAFVELAYVVQGYERQRGSTVVTEHYRSRFQEPFLGLWQTGLTKTVLPAEEFFRPASFASSVRTSLENGGWVTRDGETVSKQDSTAASAPQSD